MAHGRLYTLAQAAMGGVIILYLQAVNNHLNIMGFVAVELHTILYLTDLTSTRTLRNPCLAICSKSSR